MQKIHFYLLPNRITVTTDRAGYSTELRQVYQRNFKIYKGIDNTIEFDIRNADQRREDISEFDVLVKFFDSKRTELLEVTGTAVPNKTGIMSITISKEDLENITPQLLSVSAQLVNNSEEKLLYTDSQFGIFITAELLDGYNPASSFVDQLSVFNFEFDANSYFSEVGTFGKQLNEDINQYPIKSVTVEVFPQPGFNGEVFVQVTRDKSTSFGTLWQQVASLTIDADTHNPVNNSFTVSGDYRYIRFKYNKYTPAGTNNLTGMLDKIILRN